MIEVTSRHMECTHFNSDYSQMLAIVLQQYNITKMQKFCQVLVTIILTIANSNPNPNDDLQFKGIFMS